MALAVWNVRDLDSADTKLEMREHLRSNKLRIFGLLESKVKAKKFAQTRDAFGEEWNVGQEASQILQCLYGG